MRTCGRGGCWTGRLPPGPAVDKCYKGKNISKSQENMFAFDVTSHNFELKIKQIRIFINLPKLVFHRVPKTCLHFVLISGKKCHIILAIVAHRNRDCTTGWPSVPRQCGSLQCVKFEVCHLHVVPHGAEPLEHVDGEGRGLDGDQGNQHPAARVERF